MPIRFAIPEFTPHRLLRNGHAQTLAGVYLPAGRFVERATKHVVTLPDGDAVMLHDDVPDDWRPSDRTALVLHGLAGNYQSNYLVRLAHKLVARGVRTFRMDLRGCGAGAGLATYTYHGGRSDDARVALEFLQTVCPGSPVTLVGFSLSGNIVLKLLGESPQSVPINVEKAVAVCPAIDLALCARSFLGPMRRRYERYFVTELCRQISINRRLRPAVPALEAKRRLKTLIEFDNAYTGPICGFGTADNYYTTSSSRPHLSKIRRPTLILVADDDPLIPLSAFEGLSLPETVLMHRTTHGGHLGYIGRKNADPDNRWMDWRIIDWVTSNISTTDGRRPRSNPAIPITTTASPAP